MESDEVSEVAAETVASPEPPATVENAAGADEAAASAGAVPNERADPRRRLRELLYIPERERSEAHWDEIVELEIQTAPGNRLNPGHAPGMAALRMPGQKKPFLKGPGARMKRNRPPGKPGAAKQ